MTVPSSVTKETKSVDGCDLELVLRVSRGADPDQMETSFREEFERFVARARELLS